MFYASHLKNKVVAIKWIKLFLPLFKADFKVLCKWPLETEGGCSIRNIPNKPSRVVRRTHRKTELKNHEES